MAMVKAADLIVGAGGSGKKNDDKPNVSEDWTRFGKKQILTIGKKRRHLVHDDVNEDDIVDIDEGHASSSDEEEGRTSAVREKKKRKHVAASEGASKGSAPGARSSADAAESTQPKKKKKKKGKKERAKEDIAKGEPSKDATSDAPTAKEDGPSKNEATRDSTGKPASQNDNTKPHSDAAKPANKRKRKKIRSRQKNIRKDTRATESKPSHLVVGGADYKGRPLTDATRKKLGIQPKPDMKKGNKGASRAEEALDTGEWVGDGIDETKGMRENGEEGGEDVTKETKSNTEEKVLVKVGDCIVGGEAAKGNESKNKDDVGESLSRGKGEKKKRKKPKRKFKNLAV